MSNKMMNKKKTQGRKKIEIKKIEETNSRQVTFSKRRCGLFNKASELCVLTGAETAIIVQSPGERVFAFGHPSVDYIVDQYIAGNSSNSPEKSPENEVNLTCMHEKFNQQYMQINKELEDEKSKKNVVENKVEDVTPWWEESFEELGSEELETYITSMEELKNNITMRADEMMMIRTSSMLDVNQSLTSNGFDAIFAIENASGYNEYGDDDHMQFACNYNNPSGFNYGSGQN